MFLGVSVFSGFSLCLTLYCRLLNVRLDFYNVVLVEPKYGFGSCKLSIMFMDVS
jgi:hypothetical protein